MIRLNLVKNIVLPIICIFAINTLHAQCGTWIGSPKEGAATDAHTIYRGQMKSEDLSAAFEQWKIAYDIAPAADGQRDFHYTDGIKIYKYKFKNETDEAKKKEYADAIIRLYNEARECFKSGAIKMKGADTRVGYLLGREGFDRYYDLRTPYTETYKVLKEAVEVGGNNTEYIVLAPYADVAVYMYTNELIDKAEARAVHAAINEIGEHNIVNSESYGDYYQQALDAANGSIAQIEDNIFDCAYFMPKIKAEYEENPDDPETMENAIREMKRRACPADDAFLVQLEAKYSKYAAAENARRQAEFEANNPGILAKKAYDAGDYNGAVAKYQEAINQETDPSKQADYYFRMASVQGRKLSKYNDARANARKAADLKSGWGRPYMLIGDLYAKSSRNCGDSFMQRCAILAAIDKYAYAKSIDSSVADEASSRISKYNASKPDQEAAFMRGYTNGQKVKVSCWIGETVTLRF